MNYALRRRIYLFGLNKLHLPRAVATAIVKGLAFISDPLPFYRRRRVAKTLLQRNDLPITVPHETGYRLIATGELPGTEAVIDECRHIFEAVRADPQNQLGNVEKPFLIPVVKSHDLMNRQVIRDFVLSPALIAIASKYLGSLPILSNVQLLWTPPNDTMVISQKYHFDTEDYRQLKLFINVLDVDVETGPFTLLAADTSDAVSRQTNYVGGRRSRLADDSIDRVMLDRSISSLGPPGSGIFVDTSRCLHFGSRGNRRQRLVFQLQFMGYYAPKLMPRDWRGVLGSRASSLGEAQRLWVRC